MLRAGYGRWADSLADQLVDVERLQVEPELAGLQPVEVEHLGDHPVQSLGFVVDLTGERMDLHGAHLLLPHELAETLDADQRGAELVADHRDELALEPVQLLELRGGVHRRLVRLALGGDVRETGEDVSEAPGPRADS